MITEAFCPCGGSINEVLTESGRYALAREVDREEVDVYICSKCQTGYKLTHIVTDKVEIIEGHERGTEQVGCEARENPITGRKEESGQEGQR